MSSFVDLGQSPSPASQPPGARCVDVGFVLSPHALALGGGPPQTREGPPGVRGEPAPVFAGPGASGVYPGDAGVTAGVRPPRRGPAVFRGRPCPGVYCLISSESARPFRGCWDLEQCSRPVPVHVPPVREGHAEAGAQASRRGALWDGGWESKMILCPWPPLGCRDRAPCPGACTPARGLGSASGQSRAQGLTTQPAGVGDHGCILLPLVSGPVECGMGATGGSPR